MKLTGARALAPMLAGLSLASLLGSGALDGLPEPARVALALGVLVLLPGIAWSRAIGAPAPGGAVLVSGAGLGFGVAWLGLCVLVTRMLGLPFTVLARVGAPWAALPWLVVWATAPRTRADEAGLTRGACIAIALAALLAAVHGAQLGTPVSWYSDSPDHIATVRRMLASGDAFPVDAFFKDAGAAGIDPRKGLWHPGVALVCMLAHVDPLPAWRSLAALLAPLFVLNAAAFAYRLGGGFAAGAGAWALLLTYGGGLGSQYLREAVFSTKLADQLALATATAMFVDLETRSTRSRLAVLGLALGTVAAHVFGIIQFAVCFGALGVGLLVRDRGWSASARRLAGTAACVALAASPYLAWRALHAYAPVNIMHTEPQGLLELSPGITIVSFGVLWDWLGPAWILFPWSLVAWARGSREPVALYLFTTTLVVGALMFCPPLVHLLRPRLGYLLMRLPWLLPSSAAVVFLTVHAREAWAAGRRAAAWAAVLPLALALTGPLVDAAQAFTSPARARAAESAVSVERWSDALEWMDGHLPAGTVVLADPATSYSVPMRTRHWVTALVDQHSSPNDALALARILDARDALDPSGTWARTAQVVRRWGATAIALNGRFDEPPGFDYWAPSRTWYASARARLEGAPGAFERVYEHDRFSVYVIHRDVLDTLRGAALARPFVRAWTSADSRYPLAVSEPELLSAVIDAHEAMPGDTLRGVLEWHAGAPLPAGSYRVAVRFDRALPAEVPVAPGAISKPWRKLVEKLRHERYRFRADHLPTDGAYGVDRWLPGEIVQDKFRVTIPADVAAGEYAVKVVMTRAPHYPNLRLRDLLSDADVLDGVTVTHLRVRSRRGH